MHIAGHYPVRRHHYSQFYYRIDPAEILPYGAAVGFLIRKNKLDYNQNLIDGIIHGYLSGNTEVLK
jgi:hypothetical protein